MRSLALPCDFRSWLCSCCRLTRHFRFAACACACACVFPPAAVERAARRVFPRSASHPLSGDASVSGAAARPNQTAAAAGRGGISEKQKAESTAARASGPTGREAGHGAHLRGAGLRCRRLIRRGAHHRHTSCCRPRAHVEPSHWVRWPLVLLSLASPVGLRALSVCSTFTLVH